MALRKRPARHLDRDPRLTGRRAAWVLLGCLALGLALYGRPRLAPGEDGGATSKLVVAMGTEVLTLDPHDTTDSPSATANHHLYDTLVALDERMQPIPHLATRWSVSDDGFTWTFWLRPGVRFHDGTRLDASAVKASLDRLLDPEAGLARRMVLAPYVQRVEAEGSATVRLHLYHPFGGLPHHLAHGATAVISPQAIRDYGPDVARHPVGSGPFRLREWRPGQRLVLERFAGYWGEPPGVDTLVFLAVPEAAARAVLLQAGAADVVFPLGAGDVARLGRHPGVQVRVMPGQRVIYIGINTRRPPLDRSQVRQALNLAVDQEAIAQRILLGLGRPVYGPVSPFTWGYRPLQPLPYDPDLARRLLRQAGVAPGTRLTLWTPEGRYLMDRQTAEAVAGFLAAVGVVVEIKRWEWGAYLAALEQPAPPVDLFLLGWVPATGEALGVLKPLFESTSRANHGGYRSAALDRMLLAAERAQDPALRLSLYAAMQRRLADEAPWIFLHTLDQTVGLRQGVGGLQVYSTELVSFRRAHKAPR